MRKIAHSERTALPFAIRAAVAPTSTGSIRMMSRAGPLLAALRRLGFLAAGGCFREGAQVAASAGARRASAAMAGMSNPSHTANRHAAVTG